MIAYVEDIFARDFVEDYLPKVIMTRIYSILKKRNLSKMNEYLMNTYSITIKDVLNAIEFSVNKCNNVYSLSINNNIIEPKSQEKVISLVKLIEYGTLDIRGINVMSSTFNYIQNHLKEIYMLYVMKGGK